MVDWFEDLVGSSALVGKLAFGIITSFYLYLFFKGLGVAFTTIQRISIRHLFQISALTFWILFAIKYFCLSVSLAENAMLFPLWFY